MRPCSDWLQSSPNMWKALVVLSCLAVAGTGQPFFFPFPSQPFPSLLPLPGFSQQPFNSSGQGMNPFRHFAASGLQFAGSGLNAVGALGSSVPLFGSSISSAANLASKGLTTAGAIGFGGLQSQQFMSSFPSSGAKVSSSFSSSSSTQTGSEPVKTVSESFSSVSKVVS